MRNRLAMAATVLGLAASVGPVGPADAVAADKTWCMTYCDAVHLGCKKTLGWFDQEACEQWKAGCLDGCRVNG